MSKLIHLSLEVSFSSISEASQVKLLLVVEVELVVVVDEELQEGLVGATTIGLQKDSSIISHVSPTSQVTITYSILSFFFLTCSRREG
jgi:hypothetical protein